MGTITEAMSDAINTKKVKKEIYIDGVHEYDYIFDDVDSGIALHSLYCSNDNSWSEDTKRKMVIQLMDNGDVVEFNNIDPCFPMDYLCVERLHILLRLYSQQSKYEMIDPSARKQF